MPARDRLGRSGKFLLVLFVVYPVSTGIYTVLFSSDKFLLLSSRVNSRAAQMFWFPKTLKIMFLFVSLFALSMGNKKVLLFFCSG